ncbi:MAG: glycosyltransferase family 2 protein [Ectobacillus sp.]
MPTVSVIIPTYNRKQYLMELLTSLSMQTYQDFEVVIVNDAGERVEDVAALFPDLDISIIHQPVNQKHVVARNTGVVHAAGEFIMFCDDDDLLVPAHMERMLAEIEGYDFVYSDVEIVTYEVENGLRVPKDRFVFAYEYDEQEMRKFSTFVPSGSLYRKHIHDTIGPLDAEMKHYWDWDFFLRASAAFRVKRMPACGVLYSFSEGGQHQSNQFDSMRVHLDKLCAKHNLGVLPTKNFFLLLEEPEVKKRRAPSEVLWDGTIFWREGPLAMK